jgi:hypothetical protein
MAAISRAGSPVERLIGAGNPDVRNAWLRWLGVRRKIEQAKKAAHGSNAVTLDLGLLINI